VITESVSTAIQYGWSVIPVAANKRPTISTWKPYQERHPTPEELSAWDKRDPAAWAVVTGSVSGIVILDFDGKGGAETMRMLGLDPHVRTGSGGYHVYFRHPGWTVATLNCKSKREIGERWPGLDIRADGGYAVFAGRNQSGTYEWLRNPEPDTLNVLPDDLREYLGLLHAPRPQPTAPPPLSSTIASVDTERLISKALAQAPVDGRNNAGFRLACQLRDNGYGQVEAESVMLNYARRTGEINTKGQREAYGASEVRATIKEAYSHAPREPWNVRSPYFPSPQALSSPLRHDSNAPDLVRFNLTDSGNAERLIALHGEDLRYCTEMKKWLTWDGRRWRIDDQECIRQFGVQTMRTLYMQAAGIQDKELREAIEKHARKSENAGAITNMLAQAKLPRVCISARQLDADPCVLNCLSGTIDLKTGEERPHQREDLITKLCSVEYDPNARCDRFLSFLRRIMDNREGLIDYLQRAFGYALTGIVTEKAVICLFGQGDNGKTTLLELFRYILGDYSTQVLIETLMTKQQDSNANLADLADLRGARFVTTSEAEEGQRLSEGRLKYLTGMGEIKTCRKYENHIAFPPTHKLFMDANHRPIVRGTDKAIWGRLKPVGFTVTIPAQEKDKVLLDKLKQEAAGILTWAVWGCLDWQRNGLGDPPEVQQETIRWKEENDPLKEFIEDTCEVGEEQFVKVKDLWKAYESWVEENGEKRHMLPRNKFIDRLESLGYQRKQRKSDGVNVRTWFGIGLK
jgi:putative DNA primase/helicase